MNTEPWIAPLTREKLAAPAPQGARHHQIVQIASSLIGNGHSPQAIFDRIRPNYGPDIGDQEITKVIEWACRRITPNQTAYRFQTPSRHKQEAIPPEEHITRFLGGFACEDYDLWEKSPALRTCRFSEMASLLLETLFMPGEWINIVSTCNLREPKHPPLGYGVSKERDSWLKVFRQGTVPVSQGGTWIRMNPTDGKGVSDTNITRYRFLLLEFDRIPIPLQRAFLGYLKLPIAAIITSGGKSLHAWVRLNAPDFAQYREKARAILNTLAPFGVDKANQNPSRLSRLPGVIRPNGNPDNNQQTLVYLNPSFSCLPIFR